MNTYRTVDTTGYRFFFACAFGALGGFVQFLLGMIWSFEDFSFGGYAGFGAQMLAGLCLLISGWLAGSSRE